MAARSHAWSNSKSCPESPRRYGNSSLNATMFFFLRHSRGSGMHFRRRRFRRKQFPLKRIRLDPAAERLDRVDEFVHFVEPLMDRRVTQIRHLIDLTEFLQHLRSDELGCDLAPARFQLMHDLVDRALEGDQADRPFLARLRETVHEFAPVERLMGPVPLDDAQIRALDLLVRSEPVRALE